MLSLVGISTHTAASDLDQSPTHHLYLCSFMNTTADVGLPLAVSVPEHCQRVSDAEKLARKIHSVTAAAIDAAETFAVRFILIPNLEVTGVTRFYRAASVWDDRLGGKLDPANFLLNFLIGNKLATRINGPVLQVRSC